MNGPIQTGEIQLIKTTDYLLMLLIFLIGVTIILLISPFVTVYKYWKHRYMPTTCCREDCLSSPWGHPKVNHIGQCGGCEQVQIQHPDLYCEKCLKAKGVNR